MTVGQWIIGIACFILGIPGAIHDSLQIRDRLKGRSLEDQSAMKSDLLRALIWPTVRGLGSVAITILGVLVLLHRGTPAQTPNQGVSPTSSPTAALSQPKIPAPSIPSHTRPPIRKPGQNATPPQSVTQGGHDNQQTVNQAPVTQNNGGGCNQQVVGGSNNTNTCGDIAKDISPNDMTALVGHLKSAPTKPKIEIVADQFSGTAPFPQKFYDALHDAGWPMMNEGVVNTIAFAAPGNKFQGAVITVKGEPLKENIFIGPPDPLAYIGASLDSFGIPRILHREPDFPEGEIAVSFEGGFPK